MVPAGYQLYQKINWNISADIITNMNNLRNQIFVAVSAAITQKYPTQTDVDHTYVADTAIKLTNILYDKYNKTKQSKEDAKDLLTES